MSEIPFVESVGAGVERIPLRTPTLPPATHTNSYLVGAERFYVIEPASPWPEEQRALEEAVAARLAGGATLLAAIVTHHHGDHAGGAEAFRARFGAPLLAHPATRERLAPAVTVDGTLDEGDALDDPDLEVLHTPGHAPGHLCIRSRAHGWMVVGDMVASEGTILIDPDDGGDMDAYLAQLRRLAALGPSRLLPAHGDPVEGAVERLEFYVAHRLAREARVLAAVGEGPTALDAVVAAAYADTPQAHPLLAAKSARAHLARLESLGEVARVDGGAWRRSVGV